jgi:hypothetical protein
MTMIYVGLAIIWLSGILTGFTVANSLRDLREEEAKRSKIKNPWGNND